MRKKTNVVVLASLLAICGAAHASVVHVTGQGQGYDPGIALEDARADAVDQCTSQGGAPIEEVYSHVTRANLWLASSVWSCAVP